MKVFLLFRMQLTAECLAESPKNYTYRCTLAVMTIFMFLR